jgi:hypothetical protein
MSTPVHDESASFAFWERQFEPRRRLLPMLADFVVKCLVAQGVVYCVARNWQLSPLDMPA